MCQIFRGIHCCLLNPPCLFLSRSCSMQLEWSVLHAQCAHRERFHVVHWGGRCEETHSSAAAIWASAHVLWRRSTHDLPWLWRPRGWDCENSPHPSQFYLPSSCLKFAPEHNSSYLFEHNAFFYPVLLFSLASCTPSHSLSCQITGPYTQWAHRYSLLTSSIHSDQIFTLDFRLFCKDWTITPLFYHCILTYIFSFFFSAFSLFLPWIWPSLPFFPAIGSTCLSQDHRLHHSLFPLG